MTDECLAEGPHRYAHLLLPASLITAGFVLFYASTRVWWMVMRHYWQQIWTRNGGSALDRLVEIVMVTTPNVETIVTIYFTETPLDAAASAVLILAGVGILAHQGWFT